MKNRSKIFLLFFPLTLFVCAFVWQKENVGTDKIYWKPERQLTWTDYQAVPNIQNPYKAITSCNTFYKNEFKNDSVIFFVECYMKPSKSWVKEKTDKLLKHEQLHFDITELYARKFRKELSIGKYKLKTAYPLLKKMAKKYEDLRKSVHDRYDKETDHSRIEQKQLEWEKKVEGELKDLEGYKDNIVKVLLAK